MTPNDMKQSETRGTGRGGVTIDDYDHTNFWHGLVVVAILEIVMVLFIAGLVALLWYVVL